MNSTIVNVQRREKELNPNSKGPKRPQGHEVILASSVKKRMALTFTYLDGTQVTGCVSQYDKWTVTLWAENDDQPTTVFKHAIKSFTAA